jgi:hypothetical protein
VGFGRAKRAWCWITGAKVCSPLRRIETHAGLRAVVLLGGGFQSEEARAAPGRAGDRPRDRRQAGIGLCFPDIALGRDRHGVAPALVIADQNGPDLEVALGLPGAVAPGEAVQEFEGGGPCSKLMRPISKFM